MTGPSTIRSGVGLRNFQVMALDTSGYPAASDTSAYEGVQVVMAKTLGLTDPEPRIIHYTGDDKLWNIDLLPPLEGLRGELAVEARNDALDELLTGVKAVNLGDEFNIYAVGTDQKGEENQVAALMYHQSMDEDPDSANFGQRLWEFKIFPRVFMFPREGGANENPAEQTYTIVPQFVTKHLWGTALSTSTEGALRAQCFRGVSTYKPKVCTFKGNNTATSFTFATDAPAVSAAGIKVWVNGTLQTADFTAATTGVVFTTAPTTGAMVVTLRGVA